jgi:heat shock protein HslJ
MKLHAWNGLRLLTTCVVIAGCAVPGTGGSNGAGAGSAEASSASLTNTRWKLVQLGADAVSVPDGPREPHIILQDGRAAGSGGCNRMSGSYTLNGKSLRFTPMLATKMYCEGGMQYERPFFDALERTSAWRIDGGKLEMLNDGGNVLARFEPRAAK